MPSKSFQGRFACLSALVACTLLGLMAVRQGQPTTAQEARPDGHGQKYDAVVRPLVKKYCLGCHSTKAKKGSLDLEQFTSIVQVRKGLKPWQQTIEMLET